MSVPAEVSARVEQSTGITIEKAAAVGGGCIAGAHRVYTGSGSFFLKWGRGDVGQTLPAEAAGLEALRKGSSPLVIPEVVGFAPEEHGAPAFLLMEWIDTGSPGPAFWNAFGSGVAELHRHTADRFGFDSDNFIGRLPQRNNPHASWVEFFREERLGPQVDLARSKGAWPKDWDALFERLLANLPELIPDRPEASLLHGDLWSGNYIVASVGTAALIDPAVYYGHREADLAMTELFGGFRGGFYEGYREAWPLEAGYEARREIYNLYHLINHLNHFGDSYASGVSRVLRRFS